MSKTFEELRQKAEEIRTNQLPESNTATLVGAQLVDMVEKQKEEKLNRIATMTEANVSVLCPTSGYKADGSLGGDLYDLALAITTYQGWLNAQVGSSQIDVGKVLRFKDKDNSGDTSEWSFNGGKLGELSDWANVSLSKIRNKTVTNFYPFSAYNTHSSRYSRGFVEIYINGSVITSEDIRIRVFRVALSLADWSGERTEIVINDGTRDVLSYLVYNLEELPSSQFIHNSDFSVCCLINWSAVKRGSGYGSTYENGTGKTLDLRVKDLNNSPLIRAYIDLAKSTTDIAKTVESLNTTLHTIAEQNEKRVIDIIKPSNVDTSVDLVDYVTDGAIQADGSKTTNAYYKNIYQVPIPSDVTAIYIKNDVDTLSFFWLVYYKEDLSLLSSVQIANFDPRVVTPPSGAAYFSVGIISGNYTGGGTAAERTVYAKRVASQSFLLVKGSEPFKSEIAGLPIVMDNSKDMETHLAATNPHGINPAMIGAVSGVKLAGISAEKDGSTVNIPTATPEHAGMMTAADKAKLDNLINQGIITINGSGVFKNAASYGFLPTATASENVAALQAACIGGGTIVVDVTGTYDVNDTILLDSHTELIFRKGTFINMTATKRFLLNRGALTRDYNENITVKGLHLITNGLGVAAVITGLRGYIAFFYIKRLVIDDFVMLDGGSGPYVIHVCTFEDIQVLNVHIEGMKDAVHLGRGSKFVIRNGIFKTYDDPIALNAHDYPSGQPEYGWIEDGIIENCYDLADPDVGTVGYFARILAGAWSEWASGNRYQKNGDSCVSGGRLYKTTGGITNGTTLITSTVQPTHTSGQVTYADGIVWTMMQDAGVGYTCGVRRVHFKDIFLQKPRNTALSIHFDNDAYSRSYYPNAEQPIQEDLIFENIFCQADFTSLVSAVTPINTIKFINSVIGNATIDLTARGALAGADMMKAKILLSGTTFKADGAYLVARCRNGRTADIKILGSVVDCESFSPSVDSVNIVSNDICI